MSEDVRIVANGRPICAGFKEVMYADDTILMGRDVRNTNKYLAANVMKAREYGLTLHKGKCKSKS